MECEIHLSQNSEKHLDRIDLFTVEIIITISATSETITITTTIIIIILTRKRIVITIITGT